MQLLAKQSSQTLPDAKDMSAEEQEKFHSQFNSNKNGKEEHKKRQEELERLKKSGADQVDLDQVVRMPNYKDAKKGVSIDLEASESNEGNAG